MPVNFISVAFLYFFFHHPDSLVCVSDERNASCNASWDPVCALYQGEDCDSPTGYCIKTMSNSCSACSDSSVVGHIINGECPYVPVQVCSQEHELNSCATLEVEGTVCGITEIPSSNPSSTNPTLGKSLYDNGCEACNAGDSTFYLGGDAFGQCIAISTSNICAPQERNAQGCEWSPMPACGYYSGGDCTEQICRKTYDSYCFACADETVLFYQNGDCADVVPIGGGGTDPIFEDEEDEEALPEEEVQEEEIIEEEIQEEEVPEVPEEPKTWKKSGKKVTKVVRVSLPEHN